MRRARSALIVGGVFVVVMVGASSSSTMRDPAVAARSGVPARTDQPASMAALALPGPTLEPEGVAFWTAQRGLLVATVTTPACRSGSHPCTAGVIERTVDGGANWQLVVRVNGPAQSVAIAGSGVAWATVGRCGPNGPDSCIATLLWESADQGSTWVEVTPMTTVTSVAPVSPSEAWAVTGTFGSASLVTTTLAHSRDGGRSWQPRPDPCATAGSVAPWSVSFVDRNDGWLMCTAQPATDMQPKALFATTDAGVSWHLESNACIFTAGGQPAASVGTLPCIGYLPGMTFLPDGRGWVWTDRGSLVASADRGQTWSPIAQSIVVPDLNNVISASLAADGVGRAIVRQPNNQYFGLLGTTDAGASWTLSQRWPAT